MKSILSAILCLGLTAFSLHAAPLKIVAAENFYGEVAKQIADDSAAVTSILSNPNQDPHEFTTSASTAKAVADADIVIYNGLGYDSWMEKLLSTGGKPDRTVICVASLIGAKDGDNPHIWYRQQTMSNVGGKLATHLMEKGASFGIKDSLKFLHRSEAFTNSTEPVLEKIQALRSKYGATTVTATEPVFGYMCEALGFKMLNYDFQVNVMNDAEPSAAQTAAFEKSLRTHEAKLLFYNSQVTDPTTERLKKIAVEEKIPIVGVTETQPLDQKTYVDWMLHELDAVEAGLKAQPR